MNQLKNPENTNLEMCRGKTLREVAFDGSLKFHGFDALDYFGDGSFYLIDTPGHALGHIGGVVRTTANPDTFAVLSGDMYHSAGELRPNVHKPLPAQVSFRPAHQPAHWRTGAVCACSAYDRLQTSRGRRVGEPFFEVIKGHDVAVANESLRTAQFPDALENVLFLSAHDDAVIDVADFFPKTANNWKELGWKEKLEWAFLTHLSKDIKVD